MNTLIPVVSALIAALVSFVTAYLTVRAQAVLSGQQKALESLIEERLKAYPSAYQLLSQLLKDAGEDNVNLTYLEELKTEYDSWDSQNGYLLGIESTNVAFHFRQILVITLSDYKNGNIQTLSNLLQAAEKFELALRSDLGIYGVRLEGKSELLSLPTVRSYVDY